MVKLLATPTLDNLLDWCGKHCACVRIKMRPDTGGTVLTENNLADAIRRELSGRLFYADRDVTVDYST